MKHHGWRLTLVVVLGAVLLVTAYLLINTSFMLYDDEGYVLQTYRDFAAGHRLYDDIFSQYGPWPYIYNLIAGMALGEPLTHMAGRGLTVVHWVLCALLAGALALRLTRTMVAGVAASLITFGLLWQMTCEPSHPGGLIALMLAIAVTTTVISAETERWSVLATTLGLTAALLLLTKINVGLLFIAGAGALALRHTAWSSRRARLASALAIVGLLAMPWGLMAAKLDVGRVFIFALQFTLSVAGLFWVCPVAHDDRKIPPKVWLGAVAVFAGVLLFISAIVIARGTSLSELIGAVFIAPLRHPAHFLISFAWSPWIWPVTVGCGAVVARAGWEWRARGKLDAATQYAVIAVRLGAVVALVINAITWITALGPFGFITWSLPLLPVFLIPVGQGALTSTLARRSLVMAAFLALPQVLQAYPVAGSQLGWGTFLLPALMIAGLHDCCTALASIRPRIFRWIPQGAGTVLLMVGIVQTVKLFSTGWEFYHHSKPLGLAGAEDIRPEGRIRLALRTMTINASVHADMLFSRPGMFSYNQWSGVAPPTHQNATHWFWLLSEDQQTQIISRLQNTPRSALISNELLESFIIKAHVPMEGPLVVFLKSYYRPLFNIGDLTFHVPRDSKAVPFCLAEILIAPGTSTPANSAVLLQANVVLKGIPTDVQLQDVESPWRVREDYLRQGARVTLAPITAQGAVLGPEVELPSNRPLHGLFRLRVYTHESAALADRSKCVLVVTASQGESLAEAGF